MKNDHKTLETAEDFNEIAQTIFFPIYPVIAHQILKKADIDTGTCLDVGSGPGHLAIALATLSDLHVYAMDHARPMVRIAEANVGKYRLEQRVTPVSGNVKKIPFDDASMDLVVSRGSFFFWDNLSRGFSECMRVLRPGGMAYIGGGFGNARLRDEIVRQIRERDPEWQEKRRGWYASCNPPIVRSALAVAGIHMYDITEDDTGYWVCFSKGGKTKTE
ncbi:MAG: class I SAM-dependent methyltransferase [Methanoregula sp.]|uniref:class I SAM-dependent methyltransferase n=1 Tax=Methanoregula sp. TaxID=2052170 RepID=UPI0025E001C7|nr:class I SAM-dependent methyltransferase [Methanoregula sp.]MCK9630583.1 class I SAM-dependent methyltransferase [Methanoregula sp.]